MSAHGTVGKAGIRERGKEVGARVVACHSGDELRCIGVIMKNKYPLKFNY